MQDCYDLRKECKEIYFSKNFTMECKAQYFTETLEEIKELERRTI